MKIKNRGFTPIFYLVLNYFENGLQGLHTPM